MAEDVRLEAARRLYARTVASGSGALRQRLEAALLAVRREDFLGPPPWHACMIARGTAEYVEVDDPIHLYQSLLFAIDRTRFINNGEPGLHAMLLGALAPVAGDTVVHIGCGNGYYTAILAELAGPTGKIIGYEILPELAAAATKNLRDRSNVEVHATSAAGIALPAADGIYINAGVTRPLQTWLDAMADGGRLILPLTATGTGGGWGVTFVVERKGDSYPVAVVSRAGWIGCAGVTNSDEGQRVTAALMSGALFRARQLVRDNKPDATAVLSGDGWWLSSRPVSEAAS